MGSAKQATFLLLHGQGICSKCGPHPLIASTQDENLAGRCLIDFALILTVDFLAEFLSLDFRSIFDRFFNAEKLVRFGRSISARFLLDFRSISARIDRFARFALDLCSISARFPLEVFSRGNSEGLEPQKGLQGVPTPSMNFL